MFLICDFLRRMLKKIYICLKICQFKTIYGNKLILGHNVTFLKEFKINIAPNAKLYIGSNTFFNYNCSITCQGNITIGSDCLFGENVKFYDHNHRFSDFEKKIKDQGFNVGNISVGNNCWIGSNVTILKDVTIGDNTIVGANCLVSKSLPENCIVKNGIDLIIENRRN